MDLKQSKTIKGLAKKIADNAKAGKITTEELSTSTLVFKRITDGIYRQPSSALRELISNAYDADATRVVIETDAPRFETIIIRDDGIGLTDEALCWMIKFIGDSPKRVWDGVKLGVVKQDDPKLSPGGRKLIGKIGIGLFAVSQLTKEFQLITKTSGSNHRTIADVVLATHSEDDLERQKDKRKKKRTFRTGTVKIWRVPASDKSAHGTEVILRNLLPRVKQELSSREIWVLCNPDEFKLKDEEGEPRKPPSYHIGCIHKDIQDRIRESHRLPWDTQDSPKKKFEKLVKAVMNEYGLSKTNPSLEETFDNYLKLLWTLSLQVPVDYISKHPFDITKHDGIKTFKLGNEKKSQAREINLLGSKSVRQIMKLTSPERGRTKKFSVVVDGVELSRPISFSNLPTTSHAIKYPLLFVGKYIPRLDSIPEEIRGGKLAFEGYFFWNSKIVPKEHIGMLVRINDASGTLFDETFMKYPTSEQTRLRQITAEIFINEGLDAALNIDRESFNFAHPHYQSISNWVHNSLRQFATRHKSIGKEIRESKQEKERIHTMDAFERFVRERLQEIKADSDIEPLAVDFVKAPLEIQKKRKAGELVFDYNRVFPEYVNGKRKTAKWLSEQAQFEAKVKAIARILGAFELFDHMTYERQQDLLREIVAVLSFGDKK